MLGQDGATISHFSRWTAEVPIDILTPKNLEFMREKKIPYPEALSTWVIVKRK